MEFKGVGLMVVKFSRADLRTESDSGLETLRSCRINLVNDARREVKENTVELEKILLELDERREKARRKGI